MRKLVLLGLSILALAAAPLASHVPPGAAELANVAAPVTPAIPLMATCSPRSALWVAAGPAAFAVPTVITQQTCCDACQAEFGDCTLHCITRSGGCEQACERKYQRCIADCGGCP